MILNAMQIGDFTEILEVLNIPLGKFIAFATNYCGYSSSAHDIMDNLVHSFFLKPKSDASKADNPNWWQAMNVNFSSEY